MDETGRGKTRGKTGFFFYIIGALFAFAVAGLASPAFGAETYRIAGVRYELEGRTKEYALELAVSIDQEQIFEGLPELEGYMGLIRQQLQNQRVLEESSAVYTVGENGDVGADEGDDDGDPIPVFVVISARDTRNFIILPYPKYDSNDDDTPVEIKLKLKDYNFLGLMQTLNFDLNWQTNFKANHKIGFNLDYDLPFAAGPFDAQWLNTWELTETIDGDRGLGDALEFGFTTGIKLVLPFNWVDVEFTAKQSVTRDIGDSVQDYVAAGDDIYFTEYLELAAPFTLVRFRDLSRLFFTPSVHFTYNWDGDGNFVSDSGIDSPDLQSKTLGFGATINSSSINWVGNFREGGSFSVGPEVDYNFAFPPGDRFIPSLNADVTYYNAWKYAAIASRLQAFTYLSVDFGGPKAAAADSLTTTKKIGADLRGIKDDQAGIKTTAAVIVNADVPIHVVTTDWRGWFAGLFKTEMPGWLHTFDFEWQLAPFVDAALISSAATRRTFNVTDGWYGGGLEFLVYPARWRSLVVRLSLGADLGAAFGGGSFGYGDTDDAADVAAGVWRDDPKFPMKSLGNKVFNEITFGVGLFF
jgi:hypothetical protein